MEELVELCKSNSREAYDRLWNDKDMLKTYLEPARVESYMFVVNYVLSKSFGNRIIDIGFGSGDFLRLLASHAPERKFEIYGIDYSEAAVNRASKILPFGQFTTGDVYSLPYPANYFDQIYCIQTLEHLELPAQVISEMDRICKPDGMILISIPNGDLDTYEGHLNFWNKESFLTILAPREIIDFYAYNQNRAFMVSMKPLKCE